MWARNRPGFQAVAWLLPVLLFVACSNTKEPERSPWPRCVEAPDGLLASMATEFDTVAQSQHLDPDGLLRNVWLNEDLGSVEFYLHTENTILWTGMYLASQAFRYAVTGEAEAEENARRALDGLDKLTAVTGVDGLYGRTMANPDVAYDHRGEDNPGWTDSTAPGFEGWRFRHEVSKDGYAGLMFGYAAALEHFTDPDLRQGVKEKLRAVADHLIENGLQIVDVNGEVTEHGAIYHTALDDYPGFNAMLAASWIKIAAVDLADEEIGAFYDGCLMGLRPDVTCPDIEVFDLGTYIESMEERLFLFLENCKQNYDNFDMCYQAMYPLLRREDHPELAARLEGVLRQQMFHTEDPRYQSVAPIGNCFFTFLYVGLTGDGPEDLILADAVNQAICTLRAFPPIKYDRAIPAGQQEEICRSRLDNPVAAEIIPLEGYHFDNYLWRLDFFEIQEAREERRQLVYSPEDYLLAYWLGRLHGILDAED